MIVLMAGLPASGKSTLARELASRLSGIVLDKDKIRAALFAPGDVEYSTAQDDFCMSVALQTAIYTLKRNPERIVFMDGRPFSHTYQIDQVVAVAYNLKQEWRILECVCSEGTARKRLRETEGHPAANRNFDLYVHTKNHFDEIRFPKTVIDTDLSIDTCIEQGLRAIRKP